MLALFNGAEHFRCLCIDGMNGTDCSRCLCIQNINGTGCIRSLCIEKMNGTENFIRLWIKKMNQTEPIYIYALKNEWIKMYYRCLCIEKIMGQAIFLSKG